jgi:hypothetical protein
MPTPASAVSMCIRLGGASSMIIGSLARSASRTVAWLAQRWSAGSTT